MIEVIYRLLKLIEGLFYSNQLDSNEKKHYKDELKEHLNRVNTEEYRSVGNLNNEGAYVTGLLLTANWLFDTEDEVRSKDLINKLKIYFIGNPDYLYNIENILEDDVDPEEAIKRILNILRDITYEQHREELKELINKSYKKMMYGENVLDMKHFVTTVLGQLEEFRTKIEEKTLSGINMQDINQVSELIAQSILLDKQEGRLNTGFQGLNFLIGGGIPRGYFVNIAALTGCYKSGMLVDLSLNIPHYNKPFLENPEKKPLILRISFENSFTQDINIIYKKLHELRFQENVDPMTIDPRQAAQTIYDYTTSNGYHFFMENHDPNSFSIYDLFSLLQKYMESGYEIHAVLCDYLSLIADHTPGDRKDSRISKTFEMARNFCHPRHITFITAHQLSTEAQNMARMGYYDFSRRVSSGGWYQDCKSLHTKLDLELTQHIVKIDDHSYLTMSRGKYRDKPAIRESDNFIVYRFEPIGGIIPDENSERRYRKTLPRPSAQLDDISIEI